MTSPVRHWGSRAWQQHLDDLAIDPQRPQAFPANPRTDLLGRVRVRLSAEDSALVAYGFGQRIVLPVASIGAVQTVEAYRVNRAELSDALLILDHQGRILLRADGKWQTLGEVAAVCRAAGAPRPTHVVVTRVPGSGTRSRGSARQPGRPRPNSSQYEKAPGYQKLRLVPRGTVARGLAIIALVLAFAAAGAIAGALAAAALPEWLGAVRDLLGIIGAVLGATGGLWLLRAASRLAADGLRWALASWMAGVLAPPGRFFQRRARSDGWAKLLTAGMTALVPALVIWGPVIGTISLVHGISDAHLVAELRAHGVRAPGLLQDWPQEPMDSSSDTTVTNIATLWWRCGTDHDLCEATDPAIGGRPLPLDPVNPDNTEQRVTVVYLPRDPNIAAAEQQVTGSVWHGAPTANVISGSLFTLALPFLIWRLVVRNRRRRWLRNADILDDIRYE